MKRNRVLWDILALISSALIAFAGIYLNRPLTVFLGIAIAGFFLGFLAYRFDGLIIATIVGIVLTIGGIVVGAVLISGGSSTVITTNNPLGSIIAGIGLAITIIAIGVALIILSIVFTIILIILSLIGGLIGELVWKDRETCEIETVPPKG